MKKLGLVSFTFMAFSAVCNLRNAGNMSMMGENICAYLIAAMVLFFLPSVVVSMSFSSLKDQDVGLYGWVKMGLGPSYALAASWFQWLENIFYYPILLSFIASTTLTFMGIESGATWVHFVVVNALFWLFTLIAMTSFDFSSGIVTVTALIGLLVPSLILIVYSVFFGHGLHFQDYILSYSDIQSADFIAHASLALSSLMGIEVACVHASNFKRPRFTIPMGVLLSSVATCFIIIISAVVIYRMFPGLHDVNSALALTFLHILDVWHVKWLMPVIALLLIFGPISALMTWVISPVRSLQVAFADQKIWPRIVGSDMHANPNRLLVFQAMLVSLSTVAYLFSDDMKSVVVLFSESLALVYMFAYVLMFVAAIRLANKNLFDLFSSRAVLAYSCFGLVGSLLFICFFIWHMDIDLSFRSMFMWLLIIGACVVPIIIRRRMRHVG